jgi:hypothetical protein
MLMWYYAVLNLTDISSPGCRKPMNIDHVALQGIMQVLFAMDMLEIDLLLPAVYD